MMPLRKNSTTTMMTMENTTRRKINLAKHKMISFVVSSFFAGVSGATMAMVLSIAQANNYKVAMTYEILLMVVLGGIGSISGSVIGSLLFVATSEWWLGWP
mgnify:CR=1 FL=1